MTRAEGGGVLGMRNLSSPEQPALDAARRTGHIWRETDPRGYVMRGPGTLPLV